MNKQQRDPIIDKLNTLIKITMATAFKEESKEERILILLDLGVFTEGGCGYRRNNYPVC